jgi:uncharacterized membrane protein YphA (DoxX/SURF4 family)
VATHDLTAPGSGLAGSRSATPYVVWTIAFAFGVLLHEWQAGHPPWSYNTVPALLAIGVLLRPAAVARMIALFASLAVELALDLPDPWNHTLIVGVLGAAVTVWWLAFAVRTREAHDPRQVYEQVTPFLRVAFIVAFFAAAFAKLNAGFFDPVGTCAVWIVKSIPLVSVPDGARPLLIVGAVLLEFTIPILLVFRHTRPAAIVLGFGFHLSAALAGHTPFSGFAWSFYLLFLPAEVFSRAAGAAHSAVGPEIRRHVARAAASPLTWLALAAAWVLALEVLDLLPNPVSGNVGRWGAASLYILYATVWAVLLIKLRRYWIPMPRVPRGMLRVRQGVLIAALVLLIVNALCPYVGLKTRYSFTMYSDLRTEPGLWNHFVVPEAVRIFDLQDGAVRFEEISDHWLAQDVAARGGDQLVLIDARRLVANFPYATVRYRLDGVPRIAAPVGSDPVLREPVSPLMKVLGGLRPLVDDGGGCQH